MSDHEQVLRTADDGTNYCVVCELKHLEADRDRLRVALVLARVFVESPTEDVRERTGLLGVIDLALEGSET